MAHGYFKIEGKPMAAYMYGTVGLQHAAMAVYSAYCDRVPVVIFVGNDTDVTNRARERTSTTAHKTWGTSFVILPSGTTRRFRSTTSRTLPCAL